MKKIISVLLMVALSVSLMACGNKKNVNDENDKKDIQAAEDDSQTAGNSATTETKTENKILVVYFSATGNTKAIAETIAEGLQADIYEIVPEEPYTDADLDYSDNNSRSTLEMNDSSARPVISETVDNFDRYDMVFLGYPIWWGEAPRILDTFVESYDFSGKMVIPFCTSISSGIGSSADTLKKLAGSGNWIDGQRFNENESADKVLEWARQF